MTTLSRSHLINARTLRKRQYLRSETVRTQPNLHVPSVLVVQVLWLPCHKTIYEISSSKKAGFWALFLGIAFLAAQFHFCADLNSGPGGSHVCQLCSTVGPVFH